MKWFIGFLSISLSDCYQSGICMAVMNQWKMLNNSGMIFDLAKPAPLQRGRQNADIARAMVYRERSVLQRRIGRKEAKINDNHSVDQVLESNLLDTCRIFSVFIPSPNGDCHGTSDKEGTRNTGS